MLWKDPFIMECMFLEIFISCYAILCFWGVGILLGIFVYCEIYIGVVGEAVHFGMCMFLCNLGHYEIDLDIVGTTMWCYWILCIVLRVSKL